MISTNFLEQSEIRSITAQMGPFTVIEYSRDVSNNKLTAQNEYFAAQMNVRKKQVLCTLNGNGVILQAGAMQIMTGDVEMNSNVKGVGDFFKKAIGGAVTGESASKPKYKGNGLVMLEPTYKHIILVNLATWGGSIVLDDGLFLACEDTIDIKTVSRKSFGAAVLGGEGLFNTCLRGDGIAVLESDMPQSELFVVDVQNDVVKIDGNMAIAWSESLAFTVEKSTKSLLGSAVSGEGFVNVYKGTGRILISPVVRNSIVGKK